MVTVVDATLPTDQFALGDTFEQIPEVEFDVAHVVTHRAGQVMPFLWVSAPDFHGLEDTLRSDPSTRAVEQLSRGSDRDLYRMEWETEIRLVVNALVEDHGTLLDIHGRNGWWTFRVLFRDREAASATYECCRNRGVELSIDRVNGIDTAIGCSDSGLTDEQYEALVTAFEHDYYGVPRGLTLEELADEMGVSHQALSERLRRGHHELISNTLCVNPDTDRNRW